jgi:hypothetical protein
VSKFNACSSRLLDFGIDANKSGFTRRVTSARHPRRVPNAQKENLERQHPVDFTNPETIGFREPLLAQSAITGP